MWYVVRTFDGKMLLADQSQFNRLIKPNMGKAFKEYFTYKSQENAQAFINAFGS